MWFLALCCVVLYVVTRQLWNRWKYDLHRIPAPPSVPFLGHVPVLLFGDAGRHGTRWMRRVRKELGDPKIMLMWIHWTPWLFLADEKICQELLYDRRTAFPRDRFVGDFLCRMAGNDVGAKFFIGTTHPTPYVKAVRRIYLEAFGSSNLKAAMPNLTDVIDRMIEQIETKRVKGAFDCQELFVRMTLDAIGVVAFDKNLGGLDRSSPLYELLIDVGHIARKWFANPLGERIAKLFPNSSFGREKARIDELTAEWHSLAKDILKREDPVDGTEPVWFGLKNFIDPETNEPLPFNSLVAEAATVVIAGMDTTGHQLAWIFAVLASHPEVVASLLAELKGKGLYGISPREVSFEDIGELEYLSAIVKEGMRVAHVVTSAGGREVQRDISILGYRVPKGTIVRALGNRTVHSVEEWGDPEAFRPERWLTGEDHSNKFNVGFLKGPRDCVGQRLALLEMRLAIIKLVTRYEFTLEGNLETILENAVDGLVTEAEGGVWLNVTPRSHLH